MNRRQKIKAAATVAATMIVPGAGYVILRRPTKGLLMLLWMFAFGYITFHITMADISFIGRISGGAAVWVLSVLDVHNLSQKYYREKTAVKL